MDDWQQYYPTHSFKDKEILLREFENSSRNVGTQERIFVQFVQFIFVFTSVFITVGIGIFSVDNATITNLLTLKVLSAIAIIVCLY